MNLIFVQKDNQVIVFPSSSLDSIWGVEKDLSIQIVLQNWVYKVTCPDLDDYNNTLHKLLGDLSNNGR